MRRRFSPLLRCWPLLACLAAAAAGEPTLTVTGELLPLPQTERERRMRGEVVATPLTLAAGQISLAQAVAALAATGNATVLAAETDASRTAILPTADSYWSGVVAVCEAFDLVLDPGERVAAEGAVMTGDQVPSGPLMSWCGPVTLRPRDTPAVRPYYLGCGPLLLEFTSLDLFQQDGEPPARWLEAGLRLRFEPRLPAKRLGTTSFSLSAVKDAEGRTVAFDGLTPTPSGDSVLLRLPQLPARITGLRGEGEMRLSLLDPITCSAVLRPGTTAETKISDQLLSLRLMGENEVSEEGWKGPGLIFTAPLKSFGTNPRLEMRNGNQVVRLSHQGSQNENNQLRMFFRAAKHPAADYTITVNGWTAVTQLSLPVTFSASLARLSGKAIPTGPDLRTPTRVAWPAGRVPLQRAVQRLGENGNQVLLELGMDERHQAELPAFSGTFWEGVLEVCRAYDLVLLPAAIANPSVPEDFEGEARSLPRNLSGGSVCLGARRADRPTTEAFRACGILVTEVTEVTTTTTQGLAGTARRADVSHRLRLEPRLDVGLIETVQINWASLASLPDGRTFAVGDADPEHPRTRSSQPPGFPFRRGGFRRAIPVTSDQTGAEADLVTVNGLPPEPAALNLTGLVSLSLRRQVKVERQLAPGGRTVVRIAGQPLVVSIFSRDDGNEAHNGGNGVAISMDRNLQDSLGLRVAVRSAAGKRLRNQGQGVSSQGRLMESLWFFPEIEPGDYTVILTARENLGVVCLPFSLTAQAP
jgi:hypothetical protein